MTAAPDEPHPLDRPVWSALTSRQAHLAHGDSRALRFHPDFSLFAACADRTRDSLAALRALAAPGALLGLVEPDLPPVPPGMVMVSNASCDQMVARAVTAHPVDCAIMPLAEVDATAMLALATLTRPGPFFARTNRLGGFVGVKVAGRLVAMAGERLQPVGHSEVSGICTHPDHRGRGYAAALMANVAQRILARGETPFLHSYSDNHAAIALYARLGFRTRRRLVYTVLALA